MIENRLIADRSLLCILARTQDKLQASIEQHMVCKKCRVEYIEAQKESAESTLRRSDVDPPT